MPQTESYIPFFRRAVQQGKISHAYILEGEDKASKEQLADTIARLLLCEKKSACGQCHSCKAINAGTHPDLIRVSHEKEDVIKIDEIREQLIGDILIRPYSSDYKIYVIPDAEKMNIAAQNALLKTLEEPPGYGVILLLCTNADGMLPTILSRAVRIKISSSGTGIEGIPEEEIRRVASVLGQIRGMDRTGMAKTAAQWKEEDPTFRGTGLLIRVWFRDVLVCKSIGNKASFWMRDYTSHIREASEYYSYAHVQHILELLDVTEDRIRRNVNYELAVELLLSHMKVKESAQPEAEDWDHYYMPGAEELSFYDNQFSEG